MSTLATNEQATVLDQDGAPLSGTANPVVSSNPSILSITTPGGWVTAVAQSVGTVTLTATRHADNATSSLDVEVTPSALAPFAISLDTPVPK